MLKEFISNVSPISLGVAFIAFILAALFALKQPEAPKLDDRARELSRRSGATHDSKSGVILRIVWRELTGQLPVDSVKQKLQRWLAGHALATGRHRSMLLQAGMRQPNAIFRFEMMRVFSGIVFGLLAFYLVEFSNAFSLNSVQKGAATFLGLMVGLYIPQVYIKQKIKKRRAEFGKYWDDAIGLLIICLDAGLSIEIAMRRISRELAATAPVLAEELIITVTDLTLLKERRLAYLNLAQRMDLPSVKSVTIALIQAEKQGASISQSLRTISQTNRQTRISTAEEKAAALGPKMTLPMVAFFLPVIFVVILAPVVLSANF